MSQRMICDHLISNDLSPQSITITKELRDWVRKARSRQRVDLAEVKEKEASDARMRKAEALTKDISVLKPKKVMLEKLQKTLKIDSESVMLKAAQDSTKAHAYAIEAKSIVNERKRKVVGIGKLTDTINSLAKKQRILMLIVDFFWACKLLLHFFLFLSYNLMFLFSFFGLIHKVTLRQVLHIITFSEHSRIHCWGLNFCCYWEVHSNEVFLSLKQSLKIRVTYFSMNPFHNCALLFCIIIRSWFSFFMIKLKHTSLLK